MFRSFNINFYSTYAEPCCGYAEGKRAKIRTNIDEINLRTRQIQLLDKEKREQLEGIISWLVSFTALLSKLNR